MASISRLNIIKSSGNVVKSGPFKKVFAQEDAKIFQYDGVK